MRLYSYKKPNNQVILVMDYAHNFSVFAQVDVFYKRSIFMTLKAWL